MEMMASVERNQREDSNHCLTDCCQNPAASALSDDNFQAHHWNRNGTYHPSFKSVIVQKILSTNDYNYSPFEATGHTWKWDVAMWSLDR